MWYDRRDTPDTRLAFNGACAARTSSERNSSLDNDLAGAELKFHAQLTNKALAILAFITKAML